MRRLLSCIVFLCISYTAFSGNPVMLIRCSGGPPALISGIPANAPAQPPLTTCFTGNISVSVSPFLCDQHRPGKDTIKIVIRKGDGSSFSAGEAISITALQNCGFFDSNIFPILSTNPDVSGGLINDSASDSDSLLIEIFRPDLYSPSTIELANHADIVIPACPRASDPCSCRPENITDADGNVLFWADELEYIGNPNMMITVNNLNPMGFMMDGVTPIPSGNIGTTDATTGLLVVPFFKAFGEVTDIELTEGVGGPTISRMYSCNLAADACIITIPTMGEWSMILLTILLLAIATVAIKEMRTKRERVFL